MERQDDFYLTLPSNSSLDFFPQNTVASFKTKLSEPIQLTQSEWEVSVTDIHLTCSFYNIPPGQKHRINIIASDTELEEEEEEAITVQTEHDLAPGYYSSIPHILTSFTPSSSFFWYNKRTQSVNIHPDVLPKNPSVQVRLTRLLMPVFGYTLHPPPGTTSGVYTRASHEDSQWVLPKYPPNLNAHLPHEVNVFTDIVAQRDTPLRKVSFNDTYEYGETKSFTFLPRQYVKVDKRFFDTIHIDLKDEHGDLLPFHFGASSVQLHFRRVQ